MITAFTRPLSGGRQLLVLPARVSPPDGASALAWDLPTDTLSRLYARPARRRRATEPPPASSYDAGREELIAYELVPPEGRLLLPSAQTLLAQGIGLPASWTQLTAGPDSFFEGLCGPGPLFLGKEVKGLIAPDSGPWRALLDQLRAGRSPHGVCQDLVMRHGLIRTNYEPRTAEGWANSPSSLGLEQIAHAITWCTRVDRFAEGALDAFHTRGGLHALLERGIELLDAGAFH